MPHSAPTVFFDDFNAGLRTVLDQVLCPRERDSVPLLTLQGVGGSFGGMRTCYETNYTGCVK